MISGKFSLYAACYTNLLMEDVTLLTRGENV